MRASPLPIRLLLRTPAGRSTRRRAASACTGACLCTVPSDHCRRNTWNLINLGREVAIEPSATGHQSALPPVQRHRLHAANSSDAFPAANPQLAQTRRCCCLLRCESFLIGLESPLRLPQIIYELSIGAERLEVRSTSRECQSPSSCMMNSIRPPGQARV